MIFLIFNNLQAMKHWGKFAKIAAELIEVLKNKGADAAKALIEMAKNTQAFEKFVNAVLKAKEIGLDVLKDLVPELWKVSDIVVDSAKKLGLKAQDELRRFANYISAISKGRSEVAEKLAKQINDSGDVATNSALKEKLYKQLASEAQMAEEGIVIAGKGAKKAFEKAEYAAQKYGGHPNDYVKKTSTAVVAPNDKVISTHWIENIKTGERFEFKTIYEKGQQ